MVSLEGWKAFQNILQKIPNQSALLERLNLNIRLLGTPWAPTQIEASARTYSVRTMGAPPVTTMVCSNCATRLPSLVRSVQPSESSTTKFADNDRNGSTASTIPSRRTIR